MLAELLQVAAKSCDGEFPEGELRPVRVRQILGRIKLLNTCARASDGEMLDAFLAKRLLRMPDKDTSSKEIRASFVAFCQGLGRAPCSAARFYRPLKAKLHQLGIDQRHDIVRNGKKVRGYGGLRLVPVAAVKNADSTDLTDGTDGA
jgi:hypothetical protein